MKLSCLNAIKGFHAHDELHHIGPPHEDFTFAPKTTWSATSIMFGVCHTLKIPLVYKMAWLLI